MESTLIFYLSKLHWTAMVCSALLGTGLHWSALDIPALLNFLSVKTVKLRMGDN